MIDKEFFERLSTDNATYGAARGEVIKRSDDVRNLSKRAIFAMHRDDMEEADRLLGEAKTKLDAIRTDVPMPGLLDEGSYRAGLEEHVEALLYRNYVKEGKVGPVDDQTVGYDTYLAALADLTGELQRRQVKAAIAGDTKEVDTIYDVVEGVVGELLRMDLSGYLRNKFDQAKNSLRRAEEVRYDVSIRRK